MSESNDNQSTGQVSTDSVQPPLAAVDNNQSSKGRKRFLKAARKPLVVIISVLILLGAAAGAYFSMRSLHNASSVNTHENSDIIQFDGNTQENSDSIQFYENTISHVDCIKLEDFAGVKSIFLSNLDKYQCYNDSFAIEDERVEYVKIQFTPKEEEKRARACSEMVDCGYGIKDDVDESVNLGEYIIRGDGTIETYEYNIPDPNFVLNKILGCGLGGFEVDYEEEKGALIIDNNRVGLLSNHSGMNVKDGYGNMCIVDLEFVSYLTINSDIRNFDDRLKVRSIKVDYILNDANPCKAETTSSGVKSCFSAQAVLRSDTSVCENLASPTPRPVVNPGFDGCIIDVANKLRDPQVCEQIRYYREQMLESCKKDVSIMRNVFSGEIVEM